MTGVFLALAGAVPIVAAIVMWLTLPGGDVEEDAASATAMARAIIRFLVGASISALGFYIGLTRPRNEASPASLPPVR